MEEVQDESSSTQEVINSTNFGFASTEVPDYLIVLIFINFL